MTGLIAMLWFFDWALIVLSSLAGSVMVVGALNLGPVMGMVAFVVIVVAGIIVQTRASKPDPRPAR